MIIVSVLWVARICKTFTNQRLALSTRKLCPSNLTDWCTFVFFVKIYNLFHERWMECDVGGIPRGHVQKCVFGSCNAKFCNTLSCLTFKLRWRFRCHVSAFGAWNHHTLVTSTHGFCNFDNCMLNTSPLFVKIYVFTLLCSLKLFVKFLRALV